MEPVEIFGGQTNKKHRLHFVADTWRLKADMLAQVLLPHTRREVILEVTLIWRD